MKNQTKSVLSYDNYRTFLHDYYLQRKQSDEGFSFRQFCKDAGYSSTNLMMLIIQGKRNVSKKGLRRLIGALGLSDEKAEFFRTLVRFNQAKTVEEREVYTRRLSKLKQFEKNFPVLLSEYSYYSRWYYTAIKELVDTVAFNEDPNWIASNLTPKITPSEARQALEDLKKLGMIDYQDGKLVQVHRNVSTPAELKSTLVRGFNGQMIKRALESIELHDPSIREISAGTITLDAKGFQELKVAVQDMWKQIRRISNKVKSADRVYQVNFQLFPLSLEAKSNEDEE